MTIQFKPLAQAERDHSKTITWAALEAIIRSAIEASGDEPDDDEAIAAILEQHSSTFSGGTSRSAKEQAEDAAPATRGEQSETR